MPSYNVTTEFEMTDGRVLTCEYVLHVTPGRYSGPLEDCYPNEAEAGELTYFIDGEKVDYKELPKGLDVIAYKLYVKPTMVNTIARNNTRRATTIMTTIDRASLSKWDRRFLELAEHVAAWSKGPRKRVGAVIVRPDRSIASLGYNGPPRGFDDAAFLRMSREDQHKVAIHAEDNALRQMAADDWDNLFRRTMNGYTIYVSPLFPCAECARLIVEAKIRRVVAYCGHISPDWRASAEEAEHIFIEAGIECLFMFEGA